MALVPSEKKSEKNEKDTSWEWPDTEQNAWNWQGDEWASGASSTGAWGSSADRSRKMDYTDPEPWMSWADYKIWKRKVQRWQKSTDVANNKRADRVMKQLTVELQRKL